MKATLMVGILGASFALLSGAEAREPRDPDMSDVQQAGYDRGWDAAHEFCRDLRRRSHGGWGGRSVTGEFKRSCRKGFDEYIDNNRSCQRRLQEQNKYDEMWDARGDTCS